MLGKKCSDSGLLPFVNRMAVPIPQTLSLFGLPAKDATAALAGQVDNEMVPYPLAPVHAKNKHEMCRENRVL